jgi:hypothetical protein
MQPALQLLTLQMWLLLNLQFDLPIPRFRPSMPLRQNVSALEVRSSKNLLIKLKKLGLAPYTRRPTCHPQDPKSISSVILKRSMVKVNRKESQPETLRQHGDVQPGVG